jgi:flagellum-specific ATP synthase
MDSLTRYAMALREVALATGELPATRGYPPSVFARLPELIERSGNGRSGSGSITAVFTVLIEGDDPNDPVGDAARSFLDGHIVLTRRLADGGHFPAIDIEQSISRVANAITTPEHQGLARRLKAAWACYQRNRELLSIGAYSAGSDPEIDDAIRRFPALQKLLMQSMQERSTFEQTLQQMAALEQGDPNGAPA